MKKLLLSILSGLVVLLFTACQNEEIPFEPVTVDGFLMTVVNSVEVVANVFDELGEIIPDDLMTGDLVVNLLAEFELELYQPELPSAIFSLTLIGTEFYNQQNDELQFQFQQQLVTTSDVIRFNPITFTEAGIYTFEILQEAFSPTTDARWQPADQWITVVVNVTEDLSSGTLLASVAMDNDYFTNTLTLDFSNVIRNKLANRLEAYSADLTGDSSSNPKLPIVRPDMPMLTQIEAEIARLVAGRNNIGVVYFCLTTGHRIAINGNRNFFSASTFKLPTHMLLAEAIQAEQLYWNQIVAVIDEDIVGGTGVLQNRIGIGYEMTIRDFMRYSIVYSDNIGHHVITRMIIPDFVSVFGMALTDAVFNRYFGGATPVERLIMSPNQLTDVFRQLYQNRYNYDFSIILDYMHNTSWNDRFNTDSARNYVAHTPGWQDPNYSHDSGIFFTANPYILVVMTDGIPNSINFISELSDAVLHINRYFR